MMKDEKVTSIFAAMRNGQAVRQPSFAAFVRTEGLPDIPSYPATYAMLRHDFDRQFGPESHAYAFPAEKRAEDFHTFCVYEAQELQATQNHYRMYSSDDNIPDILLACGLNYGAAREISLSAVEPMASVRDIAAKIYPIWEQQDYMRQKDFDNLDDACRFAVMDAVAKRLDLMLKPVSQCNLYDEPKTAELVRSVRKVADIDFGNSPLAKKIKKDLPEFHNKYHALIGSASPSKRSSVLQA